MPCLSPVSSLGPVAALALCACASSPTAANKRLVRTWYEQVVSTGDLDRVPEFIAPDYVEDGDDSGQSSGIAGARAHIGGVRSVYPDLAITVEQQIAEGGWVASRITARGTHAGAWLGMAPTGAMVEITGVNLDRVVGGRIVRHGGAANMLLPLLRIGAVRAVGR